ncbi:MAG: COX15/CtaA family protein [bacterium]|tara:strand:- start:7566 stop:8495 length:930 start_codon:yes stop_codon:yes gene_type:complete
MKTKKFRLTVIITFLSLIALIIAGSVVRTTGSGLGCPDWPHCFGQWIPPTDISQLPADYKERFAVAGKQIADFDVLKTWIEYINRLLGVIVGIEMMFLVAFAWPLRRVRPRLFSGSLALFILTCIQGGIGAKVVSSSLAPHLITLHMVIALIIVIMCAALWILVEPPRKALTVRSSALGKIILALGFIQLVLGTEVREGVDVITNSGVLDRSLWLDQESMIFLIHRSFSILFLLTFLFWIGQLWKEERTSGARAMIVALLIVTFLAPISGVILSYFSMPAFAQPLHLLVATLILSGVFALIYRPSHAAP